MLGSPGISDDVTRARVSDSEYGRTRKWRTSDHSSSARAFSHAHQIGISADRDSTADAIDRGNCRPD